VKEERYDLFNGLLEACDAEGDGESKLSYTELMGNIYIFLIAGHETSGHTLAFALGLLALYPDEQEILFQHLLSILPEERVPGYDEIGRFTHTTAVLNETLRLFPSVIGVPKYAAETSQISVGGYEKGAERKTFTIPKDTHVILDVLGLHRNPRYWSDPETFKPSRFLASDWPKDAFIPFSGGPRACLGRRFAETESILGLSMLVRRYKIEVKEDPKFAAESFEQRKERVLAAKPGLTLSPVNMPLVFKRR